MAQQLTNEERARREQALVDHRAELAKLREARLLARRAAEDLRKQSAEQRKAQAAQKKAERELKSAARKVKREERLLQQRNSEPRVPHLAKVNKALSSLDQLDGDALAIFNDCVQKLNVTEIQQLRTMLGLHARQLRVVESNSVKEFKVGDRVEITGNEDPRNIGLTGTIGKLRRIRAFIDVQGRETPVYVFTSELRKLDENSDQDGSAGTPIECTVEESEENSDDASSDEPEETEVNVLEIEDDDDEEECEEEAMTAA